MGVGVIILAGALGMDNKLSHGVECATVQAEQHDLAGGMTMI